VKFCKAEKRGGFAGAGVEDYVWSGCTYWGRWVVPLDGDIEQVWWGWEGLEIVC
jgi:hypothetical protein